MYMVVLLGTPDMTVLPTECSPQGSKDRRLEGQTALITGAASGIGKAASILLVSHGAQVILLDRDEAGLSKVKQQILAQNGSALALQADITNEADVEAAVRQGVEGFGGSLHILFANAGINGLLSPIETMPLEDWKRTVDVNLTGCFLTVKHGIPYLKRSGGSIIITSSINGNRVFSNFGFSAYSTAKAAQVAFAKMAALELARYRIRVNVICPGSIDTNIGESTEMVPDVEKIRIPVEYPDGDQPLRRGPGRAEEVANLVLFLASDEASHITGTEIYIDGAESLIRG